MRLVPYIMFHGQCEEALEFYADALGGEVKNLVRYEGSPAEGMSADKQKILNAVLEAKTITIMASDSNNNDREEKAAGPIHLSIDFDSAAEELKIFSALAVGGNVTMPLQDTFWGATFGMLQDKFGINWMFNYDKSQ